MSFRRRLTLFFVLIVVVPMVALAAVLVQVSRESRTGKADARLAANLRTALTLYGDELDASRREARLVAADRPLDTAIATRNRAQVKAQAERLAATRSLVSVVVEDPAGSELGRAELAPPAATALVTVSGLRGSIGAVVVSEAGARSYVSQVKRLTGRDAALLRGGKVVASTVPLGQTTLPPPGQVNELDVPAGHVRARTVRLPDATGAQLSVFGPVGSGGLTSNQIVVAAILAIFFAIALVFVFVILRSMRGQVGAMLGAARRIGSGDFSQRVPAQGEDELAGLAREFNKMSVRLEAQVGELERQRSELEESIQRIGDAFASGLDREALLEVIVQTAIAACGADAGRARARDGSSMEVGLEGGSPNALIAALEAAEADALETVAGAAVEQDGAGALAHPLGLSEGETSSGVIAIARAGAPFTQAQRDMFAYLANQASTSIENVDLHEMVAEQAVTDGLTGLANRRRFRSLLGKELERAQRFGHALSLLMIDVDDFKSVNDTHGHRQGDEVLRAVAEALRESSRAIDEPARYGGEEFAVILPETDAAGAQEVAERIRRRIEAGRVKRLEGRGSVRVTVSVGVATIPISATDAPTLVEAADEALYGAKRAGKNCTVVAPARRRPRARAE